MRKHFLLLMLMALLPMVGFADELKNSTQYGEDGLMYVIKSMEKVGGTWTGTVSVRQNNWMTNPKVTNKTALTIHSTVSIPVQGYYELASNEVNAIVSFKVVEIEASAFKGLESITSVTFEEGCNVNTIGSEAFSGTSIEKLDLTKTKITVLNKLFEDNNIALKKVIMPATLQELAINALANCVQLGADFENGDKGGVDFSLCTKLTTLNAGSLSNTVVSEYDFSKCCIETLDKDGKHVGYSSSLNFDDGNPFVNGTTKTNKNLEKVILPYGTVEKKSPVDVIGTVFANCEALTEIKYLEVSKIQNVESGAFANDIALTSLSFPSTLKTVNGAPFNGCMNLASLTFDGTSLTALGSGATPDVMYTTEEVNEFNATLDGAKHVGDVMTAAVNYTQDEADMANKDLSGAIDYTSYTKGSTFTTAQVAEYNAAIKPETDVDDATEITDEHIAAIKVYNATLTGAISTSTVKTPAVLYTEGDANTYNAALTGAISTSTVKTPATTGNLFGDFTHVTAWGDPNTTEEFKSPLKNLTITVAKNGITNVVITAAAFTGTKVDQNGLTTVKIAEAGTFKGTIQANAITLAANENADVAFGNIEAATFNSIIGPVGTYTSTLTMGAYKSATLTTAPIVSNVISLATVNGKVNQANVLDAIGQAKSIDFKGNITVALTVPTKPNAVLTTLNFNSIQLIEAPLDGTVPVGPAIIAGTFNETNAPLLTSVTWNPLADVAENESTPVVEKRIYNYAAFAQNAFGTKEMKEDAKVTLHTTSAIADGFYHMKEDELYNVIFDAKALLPEPVEITVLGTESATYYYGKLVADKANMAIANRTEDGDQVVVYSAFVDGKAQEIYMDALAQKDDNFIVEKGQVVIVRVKQPTTTEDNMLKGVATGKKSAVMAYATEEYNTMRSVYNADKKDYEILNDLKVSDILFSSDYIATNFVGKQLYAMDNPAVIGKLNWSKVGAKSVLPPNSLYVVTEPTSSSASELNIIWLDGTEDFTGIIEKLNSDKAGVNNDVIYNLQGVRVSNMSQKGIYIKNGKKFIVK